MSGRLIGVLGVAGAGKDATADILTKKHGFVRVALADPLKRICQEVYDFSNEQLWGPSEKRNEPDERYPRILNNPNYVKERKFYLTPRHALQQLGTEWARECYPNTWIDYMLRVASDLLGTSGNPNVPRYTAQKGLDWMGSSPLRPCGVAVPDVRFQNEVDVIRAAGGHVIRITRPGAGLQGTAGQHSSETEQETIPKELFSYHLSNDGTLEDLEKKVARMMDVLQGSFTPT